MDWIFLLPGLSFSMERTIAKDGAFCWSVYFGEKSGIGFETSSQAYAWIKASLIQ